MEGAVFLHLVDVRGRETYLCYGYENRFIMIKETETVYGFLVGNHSKMLYSCHSNWSREGQLAMISTRRDVRNNIPMLGLIPGCVTLTKFQFPL